MKEEEAIRNELLETLEDSGNTIQKIALENFDAGLREAEQSKGTFNVADVLVSLAIDDYTDPAQVAFKSKALGLLTRSLKYQEFIEKITSDEYSNSLKTSFIILKDKGFKTELFMALLKIRIEQMNIDKEHIINRFGRIL